MSTRRRPARTTSEQYIGCTVKQLPAELQIAAAKTAVRENPANMPTRDAIIRLVAFLPGIEMADIKPEHIAALTTKYWSNGSVDLSVSFLDNPPQSVRTRILAHMNAWSDYGNVRFRETAGSGQVRITRTRGQGYYSYLGTDILHISAGQNTMNLEAFSDSTPESEYKRVVRHETGHCLSGDTLIDCPRDLEKYPQGIPIKELVGTQPWVYAWQDGRLVIRRASRVWLSKKAAPTVRVKLRAGQGQKSRVFMAPMELVGTPDHLVLLADGATWKAMGELQPGDRLCSLYRQKNGKRSCVQWTGGPERVREHVFVAEQVYGARPEGHDCHHRNKRMLDQTPENLEWKLEHDHHRDHSLGRCDSPETTAKRRAANVGRRHTEEARRKMSEYHRNRPPMSEETKAKLSAVSKGKPQSPELRAKRTAAIRRYYANGGRSGMYGKTASEETRAKRSVSMRATLARKKAVAGNHIVVSVEVAQTQDVYDMTVPGADSFVANGVVVHNSLGFPHEHTRPEIVAGIDPQKAIAYFMRTQGWSAQEVEQQVLTPLDESSLKATPHADSVSIMCYALPGAIMKDGRPVPGGADIDPQDAQFIAGLYPKPVAPPSPPPAAGATIQVIAGKLVIPTALPDGTYTKQ